MENPAPTQAAAGTETPAHNLACRPDNGFIEWLVNQKGSLALSTYQAGKLLLVGWNGRQLSLLPRHFDKPMGLDIRGDRMVLATRNHITLFANDAILAHHYVHKQPGRYDWLMLPRLSYHTADLNVHDIALTDNDLWIVNTRFCCLARLSDRYTFVPKWKPRFISEIVPEDRCHLNGLALVDDKPAYMTALGETDTVGGWRDNKASGGIVIDVARDEIILRSLAMPHSPRWHQGTLWVLNSGAGQLLHVNTIKGTADLVCELPGYLRGLCFVGNYALIGLCKIRETNIFGGMPVQQKYSALTCGVAVVDLQKGKQVGLFEITEGCTEIYDVCFIPRAFRPNVLNLEREESRQAFNAPDIHYWLRPENEIKN